MAKSLYRTEHLELAALLRELREKQGWVQTDLAQKLGRTQTFVSNVELGIKRLDLVELRDYCHVLEVELTALIRQWEPRLPAKAKRAAKRR